jgi:diguanylate cyclase (GGDEF)-like protein
MRHQIPNIRILESLDPLLLGQNLFASDVVAWHLNIETEEFLFSAQFERVFPASVLPFNDLSSLNALLSVVDKHNFERTFTVDLDDLGDEVRSCEVTLQLKNGNFRFRFVGHLVQADATQEHRCFDGIVVPYHHWLGSPTIEGVSHSLDTLFAESPIASLVTDAHGVLLQANLAFQHLFALKRRQLEKIVGHYNILKDRNLNAIPDVSEQMQHVYFSAETQSVDLSYNLGFLHTKGIHSTQVIHLHASCLPIKNSRGIMERVLIQLQDLSREKETLQVLQKQQRELLETAASYKAFIANSSEAIWCYDMVPPVPVSIAHEVQVDLMSQRARLSQGNKVLLAMMGAESLESILGMGLHDIGSKKYIFDLKYFVENNYQLTDHDIIREDKKGRSYFYQISCVGVVEDGYLTRVWGTTKDITVRKRYEQRLQHVSLHDSLTGLPNRAYLQQEIELFYERAGDAMGALLFIDLDRFKEINDTLGHEVGDNLLKLIGPRIRSELMDIECTITRMGGDEFAIFLPDIHYHQHALVFAHRVLDALRLEFDLSVFCAEITASIGIALAPSQATDVSTLMRYADVAMYHAKEQMVGIVVYQPEIDPHSAKRLAMMSELGRAIREDQLCLYFQPKVDLIAKTFYGVEALIRWNHPELGFVPPNDFIPMAEMTSLIHPLTAWVLEKSIAQCCAWRAQGLELSVAVNLSARNLLDENIPKLVSRLLQKYELPASALELEITESSIMLDPARALRVLQQLHELDVRLSIDDFGTGYSSLAYLKKLPVQTLKIDIYFIRNMLEDHQDELIVDSTIRLAHSLNLKVVAEGVENEALIERLTAMGCDDAQGYHIGRPMPLAQIDAWFLASPWANPV